MLVGLLRRACVGFGPVVLSGLMLVCAPVAAAPVKPLPSAADDIFLAARDAVRSGDRERLAALAAKLPHVAAFRDWLVAEFARGPHRLT